MKTVKILIVGPVPPPYGGWSHVVQAMLNLPLGASYEIESFDTTIHREVGVYRNSFIAILLCLRQIRLFRKKFKKIRPDIVVVFSGAGKTAIRDMVIVKICQWQGVPVIVRFFGGVIVDRILALPLPFKNFFLNVLRRCKIVLVELESMATRLRKFCSPAKVVRLPNYVNQCELLSLPNLDEDFAGFNVVYFGNMTPTKGVETVVESVDLVCERHSVNFHFIGGELEAGYLDKFREKASRLKYAGQVHIYGRMDRRKMLGLVKGLQVFAFPSSWPGEGQPAALVEAMALGLVPVVTRWRGLAEIIQNGHNGLLIEENTPQALADAIIRILEDDALRDSLSRNARETVAREYDVKAVVQMLKGLFREALERN